MHQLGANRGQIRLCSGYGLQEFEVSLECQGLIWVEDYSDMGCIGDSAVVGCRWNGGYQHGTSAYRR